MTDAPTKERPAARVKPRRRDLDAKLRARIEQAIEQLISSLDALETPEDEDDGSAEEEPDGEPSLGWTEMQARFGNHGDHHLAGEDLEDEFDGREDDHDREAEDEHGGAIDDEPHDEDSDREPLLGALESPVALSQLGWADSGNGIEDEDGAGLPLEKIAAARKRYRQGRSNVYIPGADGGRYDASTGELLPEPKPPAGIAVELQHDRSLALRGPGGKRYSMRKLR